MTLLVLQPLFPLFTIRNLFLLEPYQVLTVPRIRRKSVRNWHRNCLQNILDSLTCFRRGYDFIDIPDLIVVKEHRALPISFNATNFIRNVFSFIDRNRSVKLQFCLIKFINRPLQFIRVVRVKCYVSLQLVLFIVENHGVVQVELHSPE